MWKTGLSEFPQLNTGRVMTGNGTKYNRAAHSAYRIKRVFDVAISMAAVIMLLPFSLLVAALIRCEDGGDIIFRQERTGKDGESFMLYKFRTMIIAAEADGKPALCKHDDARLTRIGKFLRNHHLDELPQLWNVLKGDMSLVGPRPERPFFIERIREQNPDIDIVLQIRPGVFSPATLYNGYTDTMEKMLKRLEMDLDYRRNQSLLLDAKIVFLTVLSILTGKKF